MRARVQATDLRDATRKANALRADGAAEVFLDIEVLIDPDASAAFRKSAQQPSSGLLRYVGTPRGLAGLIADVRRLGIADGVVLLTPDRRGVVKLANGELVPA